MYPARRWTRAAWFFATAMPIQPWPTRVMGTATTWTTLRQLLNFATGGLWPDLTILLDIDPEKGLQRKRSGGEWNRLDAYALAFHQRVWQGYQALANASRSAG